MEELDIENAFYLYETLDVSDRAKDLYFDKVILQEGAIKSGAKKVLELFYKKYDVNTMLKNMTFSLSKMKSSLANPEDAKVIADYEALLTAQAANVAKTKADLEAVNKKIEAANKNGDIKKDEAKEGEAKEGENKEGENKEESVADEKAEEKTAKTDSESIDEEEK